MYNKKLGRLRVEVRDTGARDHTYSHGAQISCPDGWNDSCPILTLTVSVEEMRDLRYLLDRAIAAADDCKAAR